VADEDDGARILVADDDKTSREFVAEMLERNGFVVELAENGHAALNQALNGPVDLVLLDVVMPEMGGLECCRLLKAETLDRFLPVVLLTVKDDVESRIEGLRIGADAYVGKPCDERELLERVGAMLRIKRAHDVLTAAKSQLEELATHDELTGLFNYRYLHTRLRDEFKRAERYKLPLACLMIDIDRFKTINDGHGHAAGDQILREVSQRILGAVREVDAVARYGGEEFLTILPHTGIAGAETAAERVRSAVAATPISVDDHAHEVTVSVGYAAFPDSKVKTKDMLLKLADQAMYRAKNSGRNRIDGPA
jgi:two-component system cell cycle response regulator